MRIQRTLALACGLALGLAAPATAESATASAAARQLTLNLNILATNSRDVRALIGAGEAACALDDPTAAVGFFGRANEIEPRNARVKLGLARALVALERPADALKQFDAAKDLGISEGELAADRGLAYDLRGEQKRAQRDYALALKRANEPETVRRLALSLAIAGQREQALAALDPLIARDDRAAWRARAFVLAMTGDVQGAGGVTAKMMPALARPMMPFFQRLGGLSAAQKAHAVHFGTMPSNGKIDGLVFASAEVGGGLIPAGEPFGRQAERAEPAEPIKAKLPAVSKEVRRRPGAQAVRATFKQPELKVGAAPKPVTVAAAAPVQDVAPRKALAISLDALPAGARAALEAPRNPVLDAVIDKVREDVPGAVAQPVAAPVVAQTQVASAAIQTFTLPPSTSALAPAVLPTAAATQRAQPAQRGLASIIGSLELEKAEVVAVPVAKRPVQVAAVDIKPAVKKPPLTTSNAKKSQPKPVTPERHWAQIATGSDKAALAFEYGRMAKKAPAAFKGLAAHVAPFKATRRLLAGPFASQKEAQAFLKKAGTEGFAWTSPAGSEVETLAAK